MIRVSGILLATLLLVAGCGGVNSGGPGGGGSDPLAGRSFLSTSVQENGTPKHLVAGTRLRLTFENGNAMAGVGCNSMSGRYTFEAGKIKIEDLATTDMGCDPPRHAQDTWFGTFLTGDPAYRIDGDTLVLTSGQAEITLLDRKVAEPDKPLLGTRWEVDSLVQGDSVSSAPQGETAYFVFAAGDKVSGSTGCNQFGGTAVERDGKITFSHVFMTKMACSGDVNLLERAVATFFDGGPVTWSINADRLQLTRADGKGLELRAAK